MIFGIQLSSAKRATQTEEDLTRTLARLSAMGYRYTQLQWMSREIPPEAVAEALRGAGMISLGTQDYYEEVCAHLAYFLSLNRLTGGTQLCVSGIPDAYLSYEGCVAFAKELTPLAERAESEGLVHSIHPRNKELVSFSGVPAMDILLSQVKGLELTLDTNHILRAGLSAKDTVARYAGRVGMIHFKDMVDTTREHSHLTPVGQGCTDWDEVLKACLAYGVPYALVEQESHDKDMRSEEHTSELQSR